LGGDGEGFEGGEWGHKALREERGHLGTIMKKGVAGKWLRLGERVEGDRRTNSVVSDVVRYDG
jgi:hypothetical protein